MSAVSTDNSSMPDALVSLEISAGVATLCLRNGPKHNSLTLDLLKQLNACLSEIAEAAKQSPLNAVVLQAEGRSFSTGGDLKAFYQNIDNIETYAQNIVGQLNRAIMQMLRLPMPIISRVQGPVTGGSFGFILASDFVVMAESAFFAPYYVDVGFAPDGGWAAILPERIGCMRAKEVQFLNQHIDASTALEWGLVTKVAASEKLDEQIEQWLSTLSSKVGSSITATKRGILNEARLLNVQRALEEERKEFVKQVKTPEAKRGMALFLRQFS